MRKGLVVDYRLDGGTRVQVGEPIVIAAADPAERRWGHHQFVGLSPYPGGRILARYSGADDAIAAYGAKMPTYSSNDEGASWEPFEEEGLPCGGHVNAGFDSEFFCVSPPKPIDVEEQGIAMSDPVHGDDVPGAYRMFRYDQCAPAIQDYLAHVPGARWTPAERAWRPETVRYDMSGALVWTIKRGAASRYVSAQWPEHCCIAHDGVMMYACYRRPYIQPDGSAPISMMASLMVSPDNGRSFAPRASIANDPSGGHMMAEPVVSPTSDGGLACLIRRQGGKRMIPMLITHSCDGGYSWEHPVECMEFGALPRLLLMDCGMLAAAFGRPGIQLSFSIDGTGRKWTERIEVLAGNPDKLHDHTDGYPSLIALNGHEFLLAYSDFDYAGLEGPPRKAVCVRRVTIG